MTILDLERPLTDTCGMSVGTSVHHIDGMLRKTGLSAQDNGDDDGDDDEPENDLEVLVELIEDFQEVLETCQDGIDVCDDPKVCALLQDVAVSSAGRIATIAAMIASLGGVMYDGDEENPTAAKKKKMAPLFVKYAKKQPKVGAPKSPAPKGPPGY